MTSEEETKKTIYIGNSITVKDFAKKMEIPATDVISKLMENGILATINEEIDFETAVIIAEYLGFETEKEKSVDENENEEEMEEKITVKKTSGKLKFRPPVVAILGHVDHGKTKLLDTIRKTNIAAKEAGGITQSIGAYQTQAKGKTITFLDTPGHEAFQAMRQRGAHLADIAVLVVAADDGVKPQTVEAIKYCKRAKVPIVVAINKMDKPGANAEKVKTELSNYEINTEDRGGKVVSAEISAETGQGIDNLLDMILLVADMEEIKGEYDCRARGIIIESFLDSRRGPIATTLITDGILKTGDTIRVGSNFGRAKRLEDFQGKEIKTAYPSQPVVVIGLEKVPHMGNFFEAEKNIQIAKTKAVDELKNSKEKKSEAETSTSKRIEQKTIKAAIKKLNIILKADAKGSLEAISEILNAMKTKEVAPEILKAETGDINESDIKLAKPSGAVIIGFKVKASQAIATLAKKEEVEIKFYDIIYKLTEEIKKRLSEMLEIEIVRTGLGKLKVIALFKAGKGGAAKKQDMIVGAEVVSGKIKKGSLLDITRNEEKIGKGKAEELESEKKSVEEVKQGHNAGIRFKGTAKIKLGDMIEAYEEEKRRRTL